MHGKDLNIITLCHKDKAKGKIVGALGALSCVFMASESWRQQLDLGLRVDQPGVKYKVHIAKKIHYQ